MFMIKMISLTLVITLFMLKVSALPVHGQHAISIAVVTSDKTQARLRLLRDSPKSLVTRLNSQVKGGRSEDIARSSGLSSQWVTITFDYRRQAYFVIDRRTSNILVITDIPDHFNRTQILFEGVSNKVTKLAYDWLRRSLYWGDPSHKAIFRLDIGHICDGTICQQQKSNGNPRPDRPHRGIISTIIGQGLVAPSSIAVDPIRGFIYWTDEDYVGIPSIQKAGLDGEGRLHLVGGLIMPAGLTLDYSRNTLYWMERLSGLSVINRCQLDELPCMPVRVSTVYESMLYDMDFHQDFLITSDLAVNRLIIIDIKSDQVLRQNWAGTPYGLCIAAEDRQPQEDLPKLSSPFSYDDIALSDLSSKGAIFMASETSGVFIAPQTFAMGHADTPPFHFIHEKGISKLAIDVKRRHLFYFSQEKKSINRVALPVGIIGSASLVKTEILQTLVKTITGMAVDWLTGNLYWTDRGFQRIMVSKDNGQFPKVVHYDDVTNPQDLVIHSNKKYMFWSDTPLNKFKIERSDLDGLNRMVILGKNAFHEHPHALALDVNRNLLYWSDGPYLCRATLDGIIHDDCKNRDILAISAVKSMDIMHDYIVWTDLIGGVKAADVNTEIPIGNITSPTQYSSIYFSDVVYYHASTQTEDADPCSHDEFQEYSITSSSTRAVSRNKSQNKSRKGKRMTLKRKCAQLCLQSSQGFRCACTAGYWPKPNGDCRQGVTHDYFLTFCDLQSGRLYRQFLLLPDYYTFPLTLKIHAADIALDFNEQQIYWVDPKDKIIYSVFVNGSQKTVVFVWDDMLNITRITIASRAHLLYIILSSGEIMIMSLNTNVFRQIIKSPSWIIGHLTIDENKRNIYLTAVAKDPELISETVMYTAAILQADLDGSNLIEIFKYQGKPEGITIHKEDIIWTDTEHHSIFKAKFKGKLPFERLYNNDLVVTETLVELSSDALPHDVLVINDDVFYTDHSKHAIQRFPMSNSSFITNAGFPTLNNLAGLNFFNLRDISEPLQQDECKGIWVPKPNNQSVCLCQLNDDSDHNSQCNDASVVIHSVAPKLGICLIKHQVNGYVRGGRTGTYVQQGRTINVHCDPGYSLNKTKRIYETRECSEGRWNSSDICVSTMRYTIHGTMRRGYIIFNESTQFVVPRNVFSVDVVVIGGGGGGFDACDKELIKTGERAGMGGISKFGNHLRAYGGQGGSLHEGGRGGVGRTLFGGDGNLTSGCLGGGAAGQTHSPSTCHLGQTTCLFCGAGGVMPSCSRCFTRRGGCGGAGSKPSGQRGGGDNYGGGATGLFGGGSGGGGGYARGLIQVSPQQQIEVNVGTGGTPSAKPAGEGVVVVGWGARLEKLTGHELMTHTQQCKALTYRLEDKEDNENFLKRCLS